MRGVLPSRRAAPSTPLTLLRHERSFETDATYLPALLEARDLWVWDLGLPGGADGFLSLHPRLPRPRPRDRTALRRPPGRQRHRDRPRPPRPRLPQRLLRRRDPIRRHGPRDPHRGLPDLAPPRGREHAPPRERRRHRIHRLLRLPRPLLRSRSPGRSLPSPGSSRAGPTSPDAPASSAAPGALLLDVTGSVPRFLARAIADGRLAWNAEKDHRYLAVSPEAFLAPEVRPAPSATLRSPANQADWIVVAPEALMPAAETLRAHREGQGLAARAVSLEDVVDEFGYGEAGPHALQGFLAFAFHSWQAPSPRYVLLLGEASYDPKGHLAGTSRPDLIPSPLTKSTFLWTPADPLYAAVNGSDSLPDIAIGRINAASSTEAQTAVQKILDFETSGQSPSAGKAALVADNPDLAGEFEANQDEIATLLPSRTVEKLYPHPARNRRHQGRRPQRLRLRALPHELRRPRLLRTLGLRGHPPLPRRRLLRPSGRSAPRPRHDLLQRLLPLPLQQLPRRAPRPRRQQGRHRRLRPLRPLPQRRRPRLPPRRRRRARRRQPTPASETSSSPPRPPTPPPAPSPSSSTSTTSSATRE